MGEGPISLTREGREKICNELEILKGPRRREIAGHLAEAREHGDLSENAEYDAAKEEQAMNEKKIGQLEDTLMRARLIDNSEIPKDKVLLGASVQVKDLKTSDNFTYMIVAEEESDLENDKISVTSPVGNGLLGHKVGDIVEISVPAGALKYKITKIERL